MSTPETEDPKILDQIYPKTPNDSFLGALAGILSINTSRVQHDNNEKENLMEKLINFLGLHFEAEDGYLKLKGDYIKKNGNIECYRGNHSECNKRSNFFIFKKIEGSSLSVGYCIRKIPPDLNETDNGSYNPNNHPYKFEVLKASRIGGNPILEKPPMLEKLPVGKIEYYNGVFKLG